MDVNECEIGIDSSILNSGIVPWQQEGARRRNDRISLRLSSVCNTLCVSRLGLNSETYIFFVMEMLLCLYDFARAGGNLTEWA